MEVSHLSKTTELQVPNQRILAPVFISFYLPAQLPKLLLFGDWPVPVEMATVILLLGDSVSSTEERELGSPLFKGSSRADFVPVCN